MPRDMTLQMIEALEAPVIRPAVIFSLQLSASYLRLWDGYGPLFWGPDRYEGNGWFRSYSAPTESEQITAEGFSVTLTAVPLEVAALLLNQARQGLTGYLWFGALDAAGVLIPDPILLCSGFLDVPEFSQDATTAAVSLTFESDLVKLDTPNETRFTDAEQQRLFPGDLGFQYVAEIPNKRLFWGVPSDIPKDDR